MFYQIISSVHHCLKAGISHRDIKSDNILINHVNDELQVALTDFGMSHDRLELELDRNNELSKKWGNPALMPPEVAREKFRFSYRKADIWSVGSLVFELLGSDNPFNTPQCQSTSFYLNQLPPLNTDLVHLKTLTYRMLDPDFISRCSCEEALMCCGALLWLPHCLEYDTLSVDLISRELFLLSWEAIRNYDISSVYYQGLIYFLKHTEASSLTSTLHRILL